ncbi:cadherin-like protein 26 [Ctenodactylus gundi]
MISKTCTSLFLPLLLSLLQVPQLSSEASPNDTSYMPQVQPACEAVYDGKKYKDHSESLLLLSPVGLGTSNLTHCCCDHQSNDDGENYQALRRFKRRWVITTLELEEEDPGPFPQFVGELFNNMSDSMSLIYLISGPGVDEYPEMGLFSIEDHGSGKIYVHRPIDRETTPSFMVYFNVMDRSTGKIVDESLVFNIRIKDVNDHAPQFPEKEFNISVKESQTAGQPVFQMLTADLDEENTPNSQVLYFLVSQTPLLKESSFWIDRITGEIRLSGCLDYETAPWFILLIGVRDCGEPSLSSTATVHINVQEGNNHRPTFTQDQYKIRISEGEVHQDVLHLLVQDHDSPSTSAWRVKFNILDGNEEGHFDVLTDPKTNEGILNVIKPLDYETQTACSLVIAVENEEQLFSCVGGQLRQPKETAASATVTVQVLDANDPPAFHPLSFVVSKEDGARPGIYLGTFNATDPDRTANPIRYKLVHDPANWVTVDENSGVVTTTKQIDRESPHVNDSFYTIIVHAIDSGHPPQTGTGTLMLFLSDINDNVPTLQYHSRYLEVCESAVSQPLLLEAEDLDLEPYSDPFTFELDNIRGDAEDTWKLEKNQGRSAELLMLRSLPPGNYSVPLLIGDRQGLSQKQTVHVRVCFCTGFTCLEHSDGGAGLLVGALSPLCAAFVALTAGLLSLLRCYFASEAKRLRGSITRDDGQQTLLMYNIESKAISAQGHCLTEMVHGVARKTVSVHRKTSACRNPAPINSSSSASTFVEQGKNGTMQSAEQQQRPQPAADDQVPALSFDKAMAKAKLDVKRLCGVDVLEDDTGHLPHNYSEEGECEGAKTSALSPFQLPPDLLDSLGSRAAPLEDISRKRPPLPPHRTATAGQQQRALLAYAAATVTVLRNKVAKLERKAITCAGAPTAGALLYFWRPETLVKSGRKPWTRCCNLADDDGGGAANENLDLRPDPPWSVLERGNDVQTMSHAPRDLFLLSAEAQLAVRRKKLPPEAPEPDPGTLVSRLALCENSKCVAPSHPRVNVPLFKPPETAALFVRLAGPTEQGR